MKKKLLSLLLLILLNFSVFYTISFAQAVNTIVPSDDVEIPQEKALFDVEREIQAIEDQKSLYSNSNFNPGPLNTNNISADLSKSQKDTDDRTIINIDLGKQVISPGTSLNYVIQVTRGLEPVAGEILDIDIIEGEYWGWYFYWLDDYISYEDRIIWSDEIETGSDGEYQGQFNPSSSGRYSIVIRSTNGYFEQTRSFTVANIGLFWRVSSEFVEGEYHQSVAYVLNTNDFSPVSGAEINLSGIIYDYNPESYEYEIQTEQLFSGVSDEQGIVDINFIPPSSISENYHFLANLTASYDGESVYVSRDIYRGGYYWGWDGYTQYQKYEFIVTTDKPIYSPGETIQARILLWENNYLKVTKEPAQTSFTLKFLSPSQHVLLHREVNTDSYGVATYSFSLDVESELGNYYIVTQKEDILSSVPIRVDKYEKPSYRVTLDLDHEYVAPGRVISGNVTAEYYFGKPVSNGDVEVAIGDLEVLTGTTDIDGFWEFEYRLPGESYFEGISSIPINVTVTDTVGREVSSSSMVQITDEIYVWAYVNPWFPKAEENITVYFGAYQYSNMDWRWWIWRPLTNADVEVRLFGIVSDTNSQYITTLKSKTDSNGYGQIEFHLPASVLTKYSRFEGVVKVDAGDGRDGSTTFYFTVDTSSVEVNLDVSTYQAGDTVEFEVVIRNLASDTSIDGKLQIRIFDSDYDWIGEDYKEISSQGSIVEFQLSSYAPNGRYIIYCYLETTYDSEYGSWNYYRYTKSVEFYVGTEHEISLTADKTNYSLADSLTISGQVQGHTNVPVMVQFVKKGIVVTEYIDVTYDIEFIIQVEDIKFLAPRFWVYSFAILDDGTILEASIDIEIDTSLLVEVHSDKPVYEPGDTAEISIEVFDSKNQPVSTVLVISFIDSSVFGVQPDPETEQEHFTEQEYWPSVWTVASWKNRQQNWWFWWYDIYPVMRGGFYGLSWDLEAVAMEGDYQTALPPSAMKGDETEEASSQREQKIRDNLPENAFWNPLVIVEDGDFEMSIPLPDTIGEWTVRSVVTTQSGQGILSKYTFKTFLPFFVEINKEPFVLQDEVFIIKGIVYNYLEDITDVTLEIETEAGILLLGRNSQTLRLPSGFLGSIGWACLAQDVGFVNVTIFGNTSIDGTIYEDGIRKPLEIVPNGVTDDFKTSGFVSSNPSFSYIRYSESVQQSEFLELSLGLGSVALTSWERLIKYPYGCTEQTISCLIPDALVLTYLNETGQLTNETEETIRDMIVSGLSRLYSQLHKDGGWGWWSDDASRVYMTSMVLHGLGIVNKSGFYIDPSLVSDALKFLDNHQNSDGSWTPDSWRNVDDTSFTAFVVRSILEWEDLVESQDSILRALSYIETAWDDSDKQSAYLAGLYLDSVSGTSFDSPSFKLKLITFLKNNVTLSSDGYHWKYATEKYSWWRALGGDVEITSLALKALVENDPAASMVIIRGAVQWLLQSQSRYGWGNTADTVAAISAIIEISQSDVSSNEDVEVTIAINEEIFGSYSLSTSSQPTYYINLEDYLIAGTNTIELSKKGPGNVSYYFDGNQILRSLPSIRMPTEIGGAPNQQVSLLITLTPTSSQIFAYNFSVIPLEGDLTPTINLPQSIDNLTQQIVITFTYTAPSEVGTYSIPGFEIIYQLSNKDETQFSPGIITRTYGPVQLEVSNPSESYFLAALSPTDVHPVVSEGSLKSKLSSSPDLKITRSYSQTDSFQKGDLICVTLTITNTKQVENFLMLEDYIPIGFELDESTIEHSAETYKITKSGISFFFPELEIGKIEVKYGLVAMSVRQSLVAPAKLSSMYDVWVKTSSAAILGDTRIPIDPATGAVVQDLQVPVLEDISLEESLIGSKAVVNVNVAASDNWGIASVRIFIKQSSWNVYECSNEKEEWKCIATGLIDGNSQIYLEIIDLAGNVLISDPFNQYLDLNDLVVPVLPILVLLSVAVFVGIASSLYMRRKI